MALPDPILLEVYRHRFEGIADEMGTVLRRTAFSPNIKERLDYSCAVFDSDGDLVAQAAHIPVHLGAMPESVRAALGEFPTWRPGDLVLLNDPYMGGTHLPDLTMISPVFSSTERLCFFVASRAHHADVGGMSPGSLPLSTELFQEGLILPPIRLISKGRMNEDVLKVILRNVRTPDERRGDLAAQQGAHEIGARRLSDMMKKFGDSEVTSYASILQSYSERRMRFMIRNWPDEESHFEDSIVTHLAGKPVHQHIRVRAKIQNSTVTFDFSGTDPSGPHAFNAVLPITESACYYVVRCLSTDDIPVNDGCFRPVRVIAPPGCLVNARSPAAVAVGNVETSQRIVDVLLGAMASILPELVPAASQGTMNNVTLGNAFACEEGAYVYYETIAGGMGANPVSPGSSGMHVHMTNTMNTPIEAFERAYPVRISTYKIRRGSGGDGLHRGGDGVIREYEFTQPTRVTVQSTRRETQPWGLCEGQPGRAGRNVRILANGEEEPLPGQFSISFQAGERLRIETPGGGGWGSS